jgi:hypothetical protein
MAPSLLELKEDAREHRPPGDPYREAILAEPDEIDPVSFAAKVRTWLVLLSLKDGIRGRQD